MKPRQFMPIHYVEGIKRPSGGKSAHPRNTYEWRKLLRSVQADEAPPAVDSGSFRDAPLTNFLSIIHKDVKLEIRIHDYDARLASMDYKVYWIASVRKIYGFMLLLRFEGMDKEGDEVHDFWINIGSEDVRQVGFCASTPNCELIPPDVIRRRHEDWPKYMLCKLHACETLSMKWPTIQQQAITSGRFNVGDRLELLDRLESTRIRPARIINRLGRRICVRVSKNDMLEEHLEGEHDKQVLEGVWLDEGSGLIFPVGWATYNDYVVHANDAYRNHAKTISKALKRGEKPLYADFDVSFERFRDWTQINVKKAVHWQTGWKLECLDPLNSTFLELRVATCVSVLKDGYIRVGFDGPEMEEESMPLHCTSPLLFPVGYGEEHEISVRGPTDTSEFSWEEYLRQCKATAAPAVLFDDVPEDEVAKRFRVGGKLEAVDMCEPNLVCPATIVSIKGRLLLVHFDGWEDNIDQLFDYRSCDIFPIGWCEMYGYKLEPPKVFDEEVPTKKLRTSN